MSKSKKLWIAKEDGEKTTGIQHIGDEIPKGYELIDTLLVDSSGWGRKGEPALTLDQFFLQVKKGLGYATVDAGQFQVQVGVFKKKMDSYTATGLAEGFVEAESEEQIIEAWQYLVDTGLAWSLQGFFERTARQLIDDGVITEKVKTEGV